MTGAIARRAACRLAAGVAIAATAFGALGVSSSPLGAQQRKPQPAAQSPRRQETIEIRGQVPTPQVVTVRPREMPAYSRRVLVPMFFDHDFWPSIFPPLEIVSPTGAAAVGDSTTRVPVDSARRARPPAARPPSGTPPAPLWR